MKVRVVVLVVVVVVVLVVVVVMGIKKVQENLTWRIMHWNVSTSIISSP